jgi:hypothetical protein
MKSLIEHLDEFVVPVHGAPTIPVGKELQFVFDIAVRRKAHGKCDSSGKEEGKASRCRQHRRQLPNQINGQPERGTRCRHKAHDLHAKGCSVRFDGAFEVLEFDLDSAHTR